MGPYNNLERQIDYDKSTVGQYHEIYFMSCYITKFINLL